MPRFYFHQNVRDGFLEDPDGSDLPDIEAARQEALVGARELWASAIRDGRDLLGGSFVIADENGTVLLTIPFDDALPERLRRVIAGLPPAQEVD